MKFNEKLREKRGQMGITQGELGKMLGVSGRTIAGYESGEIYPRKREIYYKLADIFCTEQFYFIREDEDDEIDEHKGVTKVIEDITDIFAGNELTESEKDEVMEAILKIYFITKKARPSK